MNTGPLWSPHSTWRLKETTLDIPFLCQMTRTYKNVYSVDAIFLSISYRFPLDAISKFIISVWRVSYRKCISKDTDTFFSVTIALCMYETMPFPRAAFVHHAGYIWQLPYHELSMVYNVYRRQSATGYTKHKGKVASVMTRNRAWLLIGIEIYTIYSWTCSRGGFAVCSVWQDVICPLKVRISIFGRWLGSCATDSCQNLYGNFYTSIMCSHDLTSSYDKIYDIHCLTRDCSISIANAAEILQSCTKPSI